MAKPSRGRRASPSRSRSRSSSRSYSGSSSRSRSHSHSRSFSSSSSPSRSGSSRSPSPAPPRKSPREDANRGRLPPPPPLPQAKKSPPPPRKASPIPESLVLHVDQLSRNVNENHLKEIFGNFGEVLNVRLAIDHVVNLPKGFAYVEFKGRADAEKAQLYMDGAQVDGKVIRVKFTLPERKKASSPPKAVATSSSRNAPKSNEAALDADKPGPKRLKELSPCRKPLSPPRRRSPLARRGSPRRGLDSPPPPRRLQILLFVVELILLIDEVTRRLLGEGLHPLPEVARPPRHQTTGHLPEGYTVVLFDVVSPLPPRRRSPRRARSPPRSSPVGRRHSRSPIRRPARSRSRPLSPRRGRGPPARRGRSSSYSSSPGPRRAPRRVSRSRSPRRPLRGRSPSSSSTTSSSPRKP